MVRKKSTDVKIKIAIISGIFLVIAYGISSYLQSPLANTQYENRPIVDLSLGKNGKFPYAEIQKNEAGYYIEIFITNRGKSDGKTTFAVQGTNARVRIGEIGSFDYYQTLQHVLTADPTIRASTIYVLPDEGSSTFSIGFSIQENQQSPAFQEVNIFRPTFLVFENQNGVYKLIDQR